jgi:putative redox protein
MCMGGAATSVDEAMPLNATAHSIGDTLRQEVLIGEGHRLVTDEPARLGGGDLGPAPHELVPAALAACVVTTMRMYARTKGWELGEIAVDVVYDNESAPRRFDVAIHLPAGLSELQRGRLLRVAEACPVRRAFEAGLVVHEHLAEPETRVA